MTEETCKYCGVHGGNHGFKCRLRMMSLLVGQIKHCHKQFMNVKYDKYVTQFYIEGFRCRLDELILYYHLVRDISFCEACIELDINYEDVNVGVSEQ